MQAQGQEVIDFQQSVEPRDRERQREKEGRQTGTDASSPYLWPTEILKIFLLGSDGLWWIDA